MTRSLAPLCALLLVLLAAPLRAEEAPPAAALPPLASAEVAAEAIVAFKEAFKAKGRKGDEKLADQDWALRQLALVQHATIVDELEKHTKHRSVDLRTTALLQLGEQRALPGYAGKAVVEAVKRNAKDTTFLMAGLEALGRLGYFGAKELVAELMRHSDYAVAKNALITIGELKDARFIEEIVKLMKDLKLEKGAKWDGVEVNYDTGTAGDHDQKMAEKIGKEQQAANAAKGRRSARNQRDIGPIVLEVMFELTGQQFSGGIEARDWLDKNRAQVDEQVQAVTQVAKAQEAEAKAVKAAR